MKGKEIKISYAYDGLIYLPLKLAQHLKLFPENVTLVYADGDDHALKQLLHSRDEETASDIAICDPFYIPDVGSENHAGKPAQGGTNDDLPVIVGCMIHRTPLWIIGATPGLGRDNIRVSQPINTIEYIKSYKSPNTGYLFGEELVKDWKKQGNSVFRKDIENFSPKKEENLNANEIMLTSNLVQAAIAEMENKLIHSYCAQSNHEKHLRNMLFTGISTRRSFLKNNFPDLFKILNALKTSIEIIYDETTDFTEGELFEFMKSELSEYDHIKNKSLNDEEFKKIIAKTIFAIRGGQIYSPDLNFRYLEWFRMAKLRKRYMKKQKNQPYHSSTDKRIIRLLQKPWDKGVYHSLPFCLGRIIASFPIKFIAHHARTISNIFVNFVIASLITWGIFLIKRKGIDISGFPIWYMIIMWVMNIGYFCTVFYAIWNKHNTGEEYKHKHGTTFIFEALWILGFTIIHYFY